MSFLATQRSASALVAVLSWHELVAAEPAAPPSTAALPAAAPTTSAAASSAPATTTAAGTPPPPSGPPAAGTSAPVPAPSQASVAPPPAAPPSPPPPATTPAPAVRPPAPTRGAGEAHVHLASSYDGAWLEGRNRIDPDEWRRLCAAPCDRFIQVEGVEMRVTAPHMTSSNTFLIEPGAGTARLRAAGGSARARDFGLVGLAAGLPVTFAGLTLVGVGSIRDEPGLRTAGLVTLSIGAAAVLAALPLLVIGSTSVKNGEGRNVAKAGFGRF